jgi:hypothetical protein
MRDSAEKDPVDRVERVVIGSLTIRSLQANADLDRATVLVEANVDETTGGSTRRLFLREVLHLQRVAGLRSTEPGQLDILRCPSCGNASELDLHGQCSSCNNVVDRGEFGWQLTQVDTLVRHPQVPLDLTLGPGGDERGVNAPTRPSTMLGAQLRGLATRNPGFEIDTFQARVRHVFIELQAAWSEMRWERARPYETDALFQTHRFWIERYEAQGLRNALDDVEVTQVVPVQAERDPWYETITVRVFARMKDYVIDADGRVVGGNKKTPRRFSEYWTFVKRSGVAERAGADPASCPSCAAPLDRVTQAGVCEYCGSKIVTGDFDWVLARIEQDEAYRG